MSKSFRSPKGILVIIAIIFVLVFSFLFKDMITYFKIIKIERLPTFKKVEISSPSRNLLVEGESNQYDIYFDKDKMGGELELKEIELFGFKANKNLEKKTDNLYTLTLSNIEQVEHVFENESNLQIYSSNSIKDKNQCYIKINWGVPAKRSIIMSKAFYISSIYTEISKPSSEKVTNMNDVYFEVKYFGDVANIGLTKGSIVLNGFTATKEIYQKDDTVLVLLLKNIILDENNASKQCSVSITGGTGIASNGDLSNSATSESFLFVNFVDKFKKIFYLVSAIITIGGVLTSINVFFLLRDRWRKWKGSEIE